MKKDLVDSIRWEMFKLYSGDPKRVQHFIKVNDLARFIGREEGLDEEEMLILDLASLLHDIGIKRCEELYGSTAGNLQEFEGPTIAGELLEDFDIDESIVNRVCFLISKHHTVKDVEGIDWQILLEADFLVNAFEEDYSKKQIKSYRDNVFKTESGRKLLNQFYDLDQKSKMSKKKSRAKIRAKNKKLKLRQERKNKARAKRKKNKKKEKKNIVKTEVYVGYCPASYEVEILEAKYERAEDGFVYCSEIDGCPCLGMCPFGNCQIMVENDPAPNFDDIGIDDPPFQAGIRRFVVNVYRLKA